MEARDDLLPLFPSSRSLARSLIPEMEGGIGAHASPTASSSSYWFCFGGGRSASVRSERVLRLGGWRVSEWEALTSSLPPLTPAPPFLPLFTLLVNKATPGEIDGVEWSGRWHLPPFLPSSPSSFRLPQLPMRCNGAALPTDVAWGNTEKEWEKKREVGRIGISSFLWRRRRRRRRRQRG